MAIKRLHYYDQQFLVESDFTDEQKYHLDMRRRLSRVLNTFGIAEGLEVQRTANRQVTVKAGTALDNAGRTIVLEADQVVDLSNLTAFPPNATVFVTIAYQESQTDPSTATGAPGNTRFTEAAQVQAVTVSPPTDGTVIRLARFDKTLAGDVPGNLNDLLDGGVRQPASPKIPAGAVAEANLAAAVVTKINGAVTHAGLTNNPHATTAAQVGALALTGGTVTGTLGASKLQIVSPTPAALRLADGTQADGRTLISDAGGNAGWRDLTRYFVSGILNVSSISVTNAFQSMGVFLSFTKASQGSAIEVTLNTRAQAGTFSPGTGGVIFQLRVDNNVTAFANEDSVNTTNAVEDINMFAVFLGLPAGAHAVSVWARANIGTSSPVSLDPGNWGGRIIVREI